MASGLEQRYELVPTPSTVQRAVYENEICHGADKMTSAASDGKGSLRMSPSPPLIRTASPSDMPALVNLVGQYWSFEGIAGFDARRIECLLRAALFANGRAQCWLAEQAGEVGGYLLAVLVFSLEHGGMMAEIDEFFVAPAFRQQGVGAALLQEAENVLRESGVGRLQLQLGSANARARDFYAARGYGRRAGFELWDKALPPPLAD
jgi:GNAT superfamily N-acetyltransferase